MSDIPIYTGRWTDESVGKIIGDVLTLPSYLGAFLLAGLALLVAAAGSAIWNIMAFTLHRIRSTESSQCAIFYQEQAILRAAPSAVSSAWQLYKSRRRWRKHKKNERHCARLLFLSPLLVRLFFLIAAVFVAKTATKNYKIGRFLVRPQTCGLVKSGTNGFDSVAELFNKVATDARAASVHVENCRNGNQSRTGCATLPVDKLPSDIDLEVSCPFTGTVTCKLGSNGAMQLKTHDIDSDLHLGNNAPSSDKIKIRKELVCAPLNVRMNVQIVPNLSSNNSDDAQIRLLLGSIPGVSNWTYSYLTRTVNDSISYTLKSVYSYAGEIRPAWRPINGLNFTDRDVSLHFLAGNSLRYTQPVYDAWFSANGTYKSGNYSLPDQYISVMGCTETYHFCRANSDKTLRCTPSSGVVQLLSEFNKTAPTPAQMATAIRVQQAILRTNTYSIVNSQGADSLNANKKVIQFFSPPLANNTWQTEVQHWFETSLTGLAMQSVDFVSNTWTTNTASSLSVQYPQDKDLVAQFGLDVTTKLAQQCFEQKVQASGQHQSFSVLGLSIIIITCPTLIIISLILALCVNSFDRRFRPHKYAAYLATNNQHMLKRVLEGSGYAGWEDCEEEIPYRDDDLALIAPPVLVSEPGQKVRGVVFPPNEVEMQPLVEQVDAIPE